MYKLSISTIVRYPARNFVCDFRNDRSPLLKSFRACPVRRDAVGDTYVDDQLYDCSPKMADST